jgi:hypothetical protein
MRDIMEGAHQVPQRLLSLVRDPHWGQISVAQQGCHLDCARRSVLTRSPGPLGIGEGAITIVSTPSWTR